MNERLKKLREIGRSVWVDSLSRDDIQNGNLLRMTEDGVLEKEGVRKFADSYKLLIEEIEQKSNRLARQA